MPLRDDLNLLEIRSERPASLVDDLGLLQPRPGRGPLLVDDLGLVGLPEVAELEATKSPPQENLKPFEVEGPEPVSLLQRITEKGKEFVQTEVKEFKDLAVETAEAFKRQGEIAAQNFLFIGPTKFFDFLDRVATFISEKTGLEKGGLFKSIADLSRIEEDKVVIPENFAEKVIAGVAGAATGEIPKFALAVSAGGPVAGFAGLNVIEAASRGEDPLTVIEEGIKGALIGGAFKGAGLLRTGPKVAALGTIGGVQAGVEGGGPEEIAESAATLAILGLTGGKAEGLTGREALRRFRERRPLEDDLELRDEPAFVEGLRRERAAQVEPVPVEPTEARPAGQIEPPRVEPSKPEVKPTIIKAPKPKRIATENQSLIEFVKNLEIDEQRGISIKKAGDLKGEFKGLAEQGGRKRGVIKTKAGISPDMVAQAAHEAGFIEEPSTSLLAEALDRNLRGEPVFSTKGERRQRMIDLEAERELARGDEILAERAAKEHAKDLEQSGGPLVFQGKRFEKAEVKPSGEVKLTDDVDITLTKPEDILSVEKTRPMFERTEAGMQGVMPGMEGRQVPTTGIRAKGKQAEELTPLEEAALGRPREVQAELLGRKEAPFDVGEAGAEVEPGALGMFGKLFRRQPDPNVGPSVTASKADIVRFLSDKLNVPIRFGRFKSKALGIFKVKPEVIRTRLANDLEVSSHEVGHLLQKSLFPESVRVPKAGGEALRGTVFNNFKDELAPIATKHNNAGGKLVEGFAEFIRRYITNAAEARQVAPRFYKFFDEFLQTQHPDIRQILLRTRDDFDTFLRAPATAKVRAHISRVPQRERLSVRSIINRWYTNLSDRVHPIKQFKDALLQGRKISAVDDPELLARTFAGWVRKADWFIKRGPSDFETARKVGPGLDKIIDPIRDRWEDFWDYAAARRVVDGFKPKFGEKAIEDKTGLPFKDWEETVKAYESPEFREILQRVHEYEIHLFNYLADSYGIPLQQRLRIIQKSYVPFYRVMEQPGVIGKERFGVSRRAFGDLPSPIKGFKGSPREIIDPLESIIKNTFTFVNLADRNVVGRAIVELAEKTPGAGRFIEKVPFSVKPTKFELAEIRKTLEAAGLDLSEADLSLTARIFRQSPFKPGANHITVWRNGKQELYRVHPDLYRAVLNLDAESAGFLVKLGQPFAEALRVGATTTPEFALGRNPIRDQFSTAINTGLGIKTPYFSAKGIFHVLKSDNLYDLWVRGGGAQSTMVRLSRAEIIKRNSEMMRDPKLRKTIIRHPWQSLRLVAQIGEEMTRLGTFEAKLGPIEKATKTDILKAAAESREGGLDFQRGGAKTAAIRQVTAFWNANQLGLDKVRRVAIEHPLRFFTQVGAGITLPSILLTLAQMDDARWNQIPQWQRDISWIILTGPRVTDEQFQKMTSEQKRELYENTIYRIPKPFELGVVFGSVPERILEWAAGRNPEIGKSLLKTFGAAGFSSLVPLPTFFVPLFENWANWSTFLDRPIVPRGLEDLEPAYQAKAHTSEVAKAIGESINFSPAKIDNLIRGWTGGLGVIGTDAVDGIMRNTGIVNLPDPPERSLSDIPFIKGFTVRFPTAGAESIQTFYEKYNESQKAVKTFRMFLKQDREADAQSYFDRNQDAIENSKAFFKGAQGLRAYQQVTRGLWKDTTLLPDQKRRAINLVYVDMIDLAQEMLDELYPVESR